MEEFLLSSSCILLKFIQVEQGADVADFYIADNCDVSDLIITADIPLADIIVTKGALAINPRGEIYTEENISSYKLFSVR